MKNFTINRILTAAAVLAVFLEFLSAGTGTVYSRFGVGERIQFGGVRSIGMGGTSIALRGPSFLSYSNPASWSHLQIVQFNGTLYYENIYSDDGLNSGSIGSGNIHSALLALPLMPSRGFTFTLGFAPMSRVGYNIESLSVSDNVTYLNTYKGSGGITNLISGFSYSPRSDISFGGAFLYRMGLLKYDWTSAHSVTGFGNGWTYRELDVKGVAGQFGVMYTGFLSPRREGETGPLTIGAVFTTPTSLNAEDVFIIRYSTGSRDTVLSSGKIEVPSMAGFGVSYNIDRRNLAAVEIRYEAWDKFRKFGRPESQIRDSYRVGVGWERAGRPEQGSGFFDRTSFRVGLIYNASYFNINDSPINESFITAGLGLPISGTAFLDIGAQFGIRGTTSQNLQKDTMFRLYMSLSLFERWFAPSILE